MKQLQDYQEITWKKNLKKKKVQTQPSETRCSESQADFRFTVLVMAT